jgi:hypothetical protein
MPKKFAKEKKEKGKKSVASVRGKAEPVGSGHCARPPAQLILRLAGRIKTSGRLTFSVTPHASPWTLSLSSLLPPSSPHLHFLPAAPSWRLLTAARPPSAPTTRPRSFPASSPQAARRALAGSASRSQGSWPTEGGGTRSSHRHSPEPRCPEAHTKLPQALTGAPLPRGAAASPWEGQPWNQVSSPPVSACWIFFKIFIWILLLIFP